MNPANTLEQVPPGEDAAIADLIALQRSLMDPTHPRRGQHAKSHGLVRGTFAIRNDIPQSLRNGLFASSGEYECWIRFSSGFMEDDRQPDVHGIAIKLLGLPGGAEQDFLLVDHETFFAKDVRRTVAVFSRHVQLLMSGVSAEEHDRLLVAEYPVEGVLLGGFVRTADASPLETKYFSGTPFAMGTSAVKYQLLPQAKNKSTSKKADSPNFLRAALAQHLAASQASFDFCVQPQRDATTDPVEDPTVAWGGPAIPVAVLTIPPQQFDTPERAAKEETLSFTASNALPEHRPLGGINRGRKPVYEMSWNARRTSTPSGGTA